MDDDARAPIGAVPIPHAAQQQILNLPGQVRVAVCGRRFGKTWAGGIAAVRKCEQAHKPVRVWWIAPVQAQADAVEREIAEWVKATPPQRRKDAEGNSKSETRNPKEKENGDPLCRSSCDERHLPLGKGEKTENGTAQAAGGNAPRWEHHKSSHTLTYAPNGSRIEFHSAHVPDRLRGAGLDLVVVDEAADVSEYTWTHVIRPMLLDRRGEAFVLGTPRGTRNWLHRVFLMGQSAEHAGKYASVQLPTSANERIAAEELEQYRREMKPDEFAQECEAQFIDGVGSVFINVLACAAGEPLVRGRAGETYITGIDLGEHTDFSVLCSVAARAERAEGFARFQNVGWAAQLERILKHLELFPGPCVVDRTGVGDPIFQGIRARHNQLVLPFTFSAQSKEYIVRGLSIALESKTIALANVPELIGELQAFQYEDDGRHGGMFCRKYGAPPGLHDDCVMALALAWYGLKKGLWGGAEGNPMRERGVFG